jgi:polar amino acid transport system substrate-binding protein
MKKLFALLSLLAIATLVLTSCGGGTGAEDLYADVMARGYIVVSTDPNYEPQSFLNTEGVRPADTLCPGELLTTAEMQGFDVDVAIEIGDRLGVETCFATPDWDVLTAGSWADKWDMSVGSMTIKPPRPDVMYFTTPYYAPTAVIAVPEDSTYTSIDELAGAAICVGTATTYADWLYGLLDLDPADIYAQPPADITVVELSTDQECPQALASARTDFEAYATSTTVVESNIAAGMPFRQLGDAVFTEPNAVAFDKSSTLDPMSLLEAVDQIVLDMHADGTLSALSIQWYGSDMTQGLAE